MNVTGIKQKHHDLVIPHKGSEKAIRYRAVVERGFNAFNSDHISQLGREFDQRGELLKRSNKPQMESFVPYDSKTRLNCSFNPFQKCDL